MSGFIAMWDVGRSRSPAATTTTTTTLGYPGSKANFSIPWPYLIDS